jgi:hypothetical protein
LSPDLEQGTSRKMSPKYLKKHGEFNPTVATVEKSKEEVEGGSSYVAVLTVLFTASVLTCVFLKGVVAMGSSKPISMEVSAGCHESVTLCPALL